MLLHAPPSVSAQVEEPIDWDMVNRIRAEGFGRSRVMETLGHLTDRIGSRLTGSPGMREANEWTRGRLAEWGLVNATVEPWGRFGRGWSVDRAAVHLVRPLAAPLQALPEAWTPATAGPVRGLAMRVTLAQEEDFEEHRGKLSGRILLLDEEREGPPAERSEFRRYTAEELEELAEFRIPSRRDRDQNRRRAIERRRLGRALREFLAAEGVLAMVKVSPWDAGIVRVGGGGSREPGEEVGPPSLVMAAEHYGWIVRLLERGEEVELEIDVAARFHDDDLDAANTLAEIPGSDREDELVMAGAHLDSWHAATGSNDNAAGSAVVMEAARILQALGVRPRRTIRIALWSGEEQGLLGSRAYVERHFASRPEPADPEILELPKSLWPVTWPLRLQPAHAKLSAYFNVDNGSGRIRGVYTQGNVAVGPIFARWLQPFDDLGADTVTHRDTGSTDHVPFHAVGLPGFQFIQDWLDYQTRTHHSHLDHFDHAVEEDLKQASVVLASFLYHAAMRDELLPRGPMPQPPVDGAEKITAAESTGTEHDPVHDPE
ncbi:MAG TPA: M20/M25/M40 family metallo-hydrolase [Thermoanaerobaculia bacterium]|nr:M20/M25/M40 family metallo-hydrolase [Thermoanaerobaculia bacterium]